jgi:hypothetical protein
VDYEVRVDRTDVVLRAATGTSVRFRPGEAVTLHIAPTACVPLLDGRGESASGS